MKRIHRLICAVLLVLLINSLPRLKAQHNLDHLTKLTESAEELLSVMPSPDGRWAVYFTGFESRPTTLTVVETKAPFKKIVREGVVKPYFINDYTIAIHRGNVLEIIDLRSGVAKEIKGVDKIEFVSKARLLLVHYNAKHGNRLEIYDSQCKLIQKMESVIRWVNGKNYILVMTKEKDQHHLYQLSNNGKGRVALWSSAYEIFNAVESESGLNGLIVSVKTSSGLVVYFVKEGKSAVELSDVSLQGFTFVKVNPSSDSGAVYLTLQKAIPKKEQVVDIWYGNEQNLGKYTREQFLTNHILWYPKQNRIYKFGEDFTGFTAIGINNLFLKMKIDRTKVDVNDDQFKPNTKQIYLWNSLTNKDTLLPLDDGHMNIDPQGRSLLIRTSDGWVRFDTEKLSAVKLDWAKEAVPYYAAGEKVIWTAKNEVWEQDLWSLKKRRLVSLHADELEVFKPQKMYTGIGVNRLSQYLEQSTDFVLIAKNTKELTSSYVHVKNKKADVFIPETTDRIQYFSRVPKVEKMFWIEDNYNKAFTFMIKERSSKPVAVYSSNETDSQSVNIIKKKMLYKGVNGEELEGSLYLPANFDPSKKYPVVLSIYEQQQRFMNKFLLPTFKNGRGINARLLLESGYLVMFPDITYGAQGPGVSALVCINNALDELQNLPYADMEKVGLMGQSFGGYETNFIASHSNRFSAFISGNSISDIIHTSYAFNYNFDSPDYWRYEEGQFRMKGSFVNNKQKYINNNPLYEISKITAPMLLWAGTADQNVDPEETRSLFNVLRKYQKPVIALWYKDEGHSLGRATSQKDLSLKVLDWFDYHLFGRKDVLWINKQMKDAF